MQYGFTKDEAIAMFDRLRPEAAQFFGKSYILTLPFSVEQGTDEDTMEGTLAKTSSQWPHAIILNEQILPFVYEDELRHILMHEITHAAVTLDDNWLDNLFTSGHGPKWEQAVLEYTGVHDNGGFSIRRNDALPWASVLDMQGVPPTLGPVYE